MIISIYLILLFKSFFSVFIYQNSEEIQLDKSHIKKSLELFCQTYKNEFWGEHLENNDGEKQRALLQEINRIFNEEDLITLKKILKSAFISSIEKKNIVQQSIALRVPVYFAEIIPQRFNITIFLQLRKHLNEKWYQCYDRMRIFDYSYIAFPACMSPYYKWDTEKKELIYAGEMGVVISNEVNFESKTSSDYKKFMPEVQKGNKDQLIKFIDHIGECLVDAAYKLALTQEVKIINLNIPAFGIDSFRNYYENQIELSRFYFKAIDKALKKYDQLRWFVNFHNYTQNEFYEEAYNIFQHNKKKDSIVFNYYKESNLYDENLMPEEVKKMSKHQYLIVWAHVGDPHSYIGNAGANDVSLEQKFIGIGNYDFLNLVPILNLFLYDIAFSLSESQFINPPSGNLEELSIEEANMGSLENLERGSIEESMGTSLGYDKDSDRKKSNKNYMWWISGIGIFALLYFIYKKINLVRLIKS